jgi:3'-phosphoadenosine 5'-phosphosulfate sulfotransferase
METLRTFSWAEIEALPASGEFTPFSGVASFTIKNLECKRIVSTVKTDQKKIRLVVKWTDSRAVQHQRAYEAYYTKEGLSDYYSRAL